MNVFHRIEEFKIILLLLDRKLIIKRQMSMETQRKIKYCKHTIWINKEKFSRKIHLHLIAILEFPFPALCAIHLHIQANNFCSMQTIVLCHKVSFWKWQTYLMCYHVETMNLCRCINFLFDFDNIRIVCRM